MANDLLKDVTFMDIKVATCFESPDDMTIIQVLKTVLPFSTTQNPPSW